MYIYLAVLTISATAGLQAWRMLFDNFAVHIVGLEGKHIGVIQSVREIPGFLALLAIYLIMIIREHRLSAISILLLGLGVSITGFFPSWSGLVITTLLMSFGFHYFETTNQSLTLQYFDKQISPWVFGKLRSLGAASNVGVGIIIFFITPHLNFIATYLLFGSLIIAAGIWAFFQNPSNENIVPQRKKMIVRKKYLLFYFLTFMAGARRQIFIAFAVFLLVRKFGFTIQEIAVLFVANNIINYFLSPLIGKAIIRFGERAVLSLEYSALIVVFLAYATVESKLIVGILYVLDHIFFNFAMLWMIDYRVPFVCGAVLSFISLAAVQKIRT
ncbi:MAG: MFS transporter [Deltaproteobacteria bacterium]|nr:MFS transporter [Deltaproteobacteria bacterium]